MNPECAKDDFKLQSSNDVVVVVVVVVVLVVLLLNFFSERKNKVLPLKTKLFYIIGRNSFCSLMLTYGCFHYLMGQSISTLRAWQPI